jgi:hypothetical protein
MLMVCGYLLLHCDFSWSFRRILSLLARNLRFGDEVCVGVTVENFPILGKSEGFWVRNEVYFPFSCTSLNESFTSALRGMSSHHDHDLQIIAIESWHTVPPLVLMAALPMIQIRDLAAFIFAGFAQIK